MATGALVIRNWVKDDFPDLLWPALVLAERGPGVIRDFVRWQKSVQEDLAAHGEEEWVAERLDGRLTSMDALAKRFADGADVVVKRAQQHGLLSARVARVLASYPHMPAPWITGGMELQTPGEAELELVHDALLGLIRDGHREALIKCLQIWSSVQAGTFRSSQETIDLLVDYPTNEAKRAQAESAVRAMWGARKGLLESENENYFDAATDWARMFWGINSITSSCMRDPGQDSPASGAQRASESEVDEKEDAETEIGPTEMPKSGAYLRRRVMDLMSSFVEALETSPAHLYDHERQEVVSGLVSRAARDLIAVLGAPSLWCLEHGAHIGRMLVEAEIYLHWMATQDLSIYKQFQDYGAGKAKLYAKILEELPKDAHTAGFRESIEELQRLSRGGLPLDVRTVDTRDTFAGGKSIRAMAEEGGLLDYYRHVYSLSSGVTHSEWWSIETHAMEPCLNALHGFHLVPSLRINPGGNVDLAEAWVKQFYALIQDALQILRPDEKTVAEAFAWLESNSTPAVSDAADS